MKIDAHYGNDTGMYLVDVYLESERECVLAPEAIWNKLGPLFACEGISVAAVVDCFLHKRDSAREWILARVLPWVGG